MEITVIEGDVTTIVVVGRLDTVNASEFESRVAPVQGGAMQHVVMDCSGLSYISSSGLRLFLMLQKSARLKSGRLVIKGMRPEIKEIFDMTGFTAMFEFEA